MSKLIYIVSMGHSGSTLADMWLGTIPGVFSTGEFLHFPGQIKRGEDPNDIQTYCSCGQSFITCSFWNKVSNNLERKIGFDILSNPTKFDISIHTSSFSYKRTFLDRVRQALLLGLHSLSNEAKVWRLPNRYYKNSIKRNWLLFDAIAEESGCEYVIDSSKNFLRYFFLKSYRPKDVKLVVLIRNIHGVASSSHHGLNHEIVMERAKKWNKLYKRLGPGLNCLQKDEYYVLNYEKMCADPVHERRNFSKFIGINKKLPDEKTFNTKNYHLVAGNPIRQKGQITIRYDERWKDRLTTKQIALLSPIQDRILKEIIG